MATIFRSPVFVTIYPKPKAKDSWEVNLLALYAPNPAFPFKQTQWDLPTKARSKAVGEAFFIPSPLFSPNPSVPFNQELWDLPTKGRPKATGESYSAVLTLYSFPFPNSLEDWPNPAKPLPKAVGESYGLNLALTVIFQPNNVYDWPRPASPKPVASQAESYSSPSTLVNPPAMPFNQTDWQRPTPKRLSDLRSDILVNTLPLTPVAVTLPFSQEDWPLPSPPPNRWQAARLEVPQNFLPLRGFVAVTLPFNQFNWPSASRNSNVWQAAREQIPPNLLPPHVTPPSSHVNEWLNRARRRGRR